MRISVAMPTYNGGRFLAEQLNSIAKQSRQPDELVITDDTSTDHTIAVAEQFAAAAPFPVRIERNSIGLGCNDNFARAIALCTGELIALCDQDDVWHVDHLNKLIGPLEADAGVVLVISNSEYVDEQLRPTNTTLWKAERFDSADVRRIARGPLFAEWARHHVVAGHALMFCADLRDVMLPFHRYQTYDHWLSLVAAACGQIVMIDEKLTLHRHHPGQAIAHDEVSLAERMRREASVSVDFFARQVEVFQSLKARLAAHRDRLTASGVERTLDERIALFDTRRQMRKGGVARRVSMATATLLRGRYHRHARGWLTFARDVRG